MTRKFGILREGPPVSGISERAAFIVDKNGKIAFAKVYGISELPNIEELLTALRGLTERLRRAFCPYAFSMPRLLF